MAAAGTMNELTAAALRLSYAVGVVIIETILAERAQQPVAWPVCGRCGHRLVSKGRVERQLTTRLGVARWRRPVGRCPRGCRGEQVAPLDSALGLAPGQRTCDLLQRDACLLAVFVPFATAVRILKRLFPVRVSDSALWLWVQASGERARRAELAELTDLEAGVAPTPEQMDEALAKLMLLIGADGVMVPFRPQPRTPRGRTIWREIKVGVLTRLRWRAKATGEQVGVLVQRRLVAVLGGVDALASRLRLEALRQGLDRASQVVWVSDGARGLWRIAREHFPQAIAILDFYHAAQTLFEAAEAWFAYLPSAQSWFRQARHDLRHGHVDALISTLREQAGRLDRGPERCHILERVANYLNDHRPHLRYPDFAARYLPLGSGFVESAVKWLIQQRFKGVGMRWSEDGFNNLLLRAHP